MSALEEVLTLLLSIPVGLSLLARYTPAAITSSTYQLALHRLQSALTLFLFLLLATSGLSLEHALYLRLSLKPKEHDRKVHPFVVVTSVPRGALNVQQAVLAASLLALGSQYWLSRQPTSATAQLARTLLAHASLLISAAVTLLTLPLDGPSLRVNYTVAGLDSILAQAPETTGAANSEERHAFAPIDIILPLLPERTAEGKVLPLPGGAGAAVSEEAKKAMSPDQLKALLEAGPDAQGWVKVASTNKRRDVYVRRTAGGRGRGWELRTELAHDHPLKPKDE